VERAIAMLGLDLVRSMALSIVVVDLFKPGRNNSINNVDFWRHCAACAAASERLARRLAYPNPQEAFIAGLLHDVGKLVFSSWDDALYTKTVLEAAANRTPLIDAEESHLGMGHNRLGKVLMDYWHFPALLSNTAWLHHQPVPHFGPGPREELPFIVKCANTLCHIQRFGNSGNRVPDMTREELEAGLRAVSGSIQRSLRSGLQAFGRNFGIL
jgi:HD-like signal output (HDOD) protein